MDSRLAALPLKGTVTIDGATLELRGASQPLAVCLRLGTQPPVCAELQSASGPGIDGVVVGGQWIVFAATATSAHFDVDGKTVHARQAMLDGWHLALVLPGSHGTTVNVSGDSSTNRPGS